MVTRIRLKRYGAKHSAHYRVAVMDQKRPRDGRAIEEIGYYDPNTDPATIQIQQDRAQYWLSVGAQPTEQVAALLKLTGDWGKFKGDKNAVSTVKVAGEKEEFVADTAKKSVIKPKAEKKVEAPVADADEADAPADDAAADAE